MTNKNMENIVEGVGEGEMEEREEVQIIEASDEVFESSHALVERPKIYECEIERNIGEEHFAASDYLRILVFNIFLSMSDTMTDFTQV